MSDFELLSVFGLASENVETLVDLEGVSVDDLGVLLTRQLQCERSLADSGRPHDEERVGRIQRAVVCAPPSAHNVATKAG